MKKIVIVFLLVILFPIFVFSQDGYPANYAKEPRFKALICYDPSAEPDHVKFDKDAIEFFHKLSYGEGFFMMSQRALTTILTKGLRNIPS